MTGEHVQKPNFAGVLKDKELTLKAEILGF
jgi:hypothetical protein